jgi:hypothetical protein
MLRMNESFGKEVVYSHGCRQASVATLLLINTAEWAVMAGCSGFAMWRDTQTLKVAV